MKPVPAVPPFPSRAEIARLFGDIASGFAATRTSPWPETIEFEARLPRKSSILDVGCGNGRNLAFLGECGHVVVGLDASAELLRFAAKGRGEGLLCGDAVVLPFRDRSFDAVHCVATLHHLPSEEERLRALREFVRVLRPRGVTLASVWALDQPRLRKSADPFELQGRDATSDWLIPWTRSDGHAFLRFYHLFRSGELEGLARAAGLAVEEGRRMGENLVVLAARP